jgi:hypothetical protein
LSADIGSNAINTVNVRHVVGRNCIHWKNYLKYFRPVALRVVKEIAQYKLISISKVYA